MTANTTRTALQLVSGDQGLVEVEVAPDETRPAQIGFTLTIRNTSDDALDVSNPYDGISYHLISPSGSPVQVKAPPSAAKVHVPQDPSKRAAYLELVHVQIGGTQQEGAAAELTSVQLAAGGETVLQLSINSSIDLSNRAVLDHVPTGDYELVVMLRIVATADGERHPLLLRTATNITTSVA